MVDSHPARSVRFIAVAAALCAASLIPAARASAQACEQGTVTECHTEGMQQQTGQHYARALELFVRGCEYGQQDACTAIAALLREHPEARAEGAPISGLLTSECERDNEALCTQLAYDVVDDVDNLRRSGQARAALNAACERNLGAACSARGVITQTRRRRAGLRQARADYERGCELRDGRGCRRLGELLEPTEPALAQERFASGCQQGDQVSCGHQGRLLAATDAATAAPLLSRGCDAGNGEACTLLGRLHQERRFPGADASAAERAYGRACERDEHPEACGRLGGFMHRRGESQAAEPLLRTGCGGQYPQACADLGELLAARDQPRAAAPFLARARRFNESRCRRGTGEACLSVARDYEQGRGVRASEGQAGLWLRRACVAGAGGHTRCLEAGLATARPGNARRAEPVLRPLCEMGEVRACVALAPIVPRRTREPLYRRACELGEETACEQAPGAAPSPELIAAAATAVAAATRREQAAATPAAVTRPLDATHTPDPDGRATEQAQQQAAQQQAAQQQAAQQQAAQEQAEVARRQAEQAQRQAEARQRQTAQALAAAQRREAAAQRLAARATAQEAAQRTRAEQAAAREAAARERAGAATTREAAAREAAGQAAAREAEAAQRAEQGEAAARQQAQEAAAARRRAEQLAAREARARQQAERLAAREARSRQRAEQALAGLAAAREQAQQASQAEAQARAQAEASATEAQQARQSAEREAAARAEAEEAEAAQRARADRLVEARRRAEAREAQAREQAQQAAAREAALVQQAEARETARRQATEATEREAQARRRAEARVAEARRRAEESAQREAAARQQVEEAGQARAAAAAVAAREATARRRAQAREAAARRQAEQATARERATRERAAAREAAQRRQAEQAAAREAAQRRQAEEAAAREAAARRRAQAEDAQERRRAEAAAAREAAARQRAEQAAAREAAARQRAEAAATREAAAREAAQQREAEQRQRAEALAASAAEAQRQAEAREQELRTQIEEAQARQAAAERQRRQHEQERQQATEARAEAQRERTQQQAEARRAAARRATEERARVAEERRDAQARRREERRRAQLAARRTREVEGNEAEQLALACEAGHVTSCEPAGIRLRDGDGTEADPQRAVTLFERACAAESASACVAAIELFEPQTPADQRRLTHLHEGACTHGAGNAEACARAVARVAEADSESTRPLLLRLAHRGCTLRASGTCVVAGDIASQGRGVRIDREQAVESYGRVCGTEGGPGCDGLDSLCQAGVLRACERRAGGVQSDRAPPHRVLDEAAALRNGGDDGAAARLLERAVTGGGTPRLLGELGLAYQGAGSFVGAERRLTEALEAQQDPWVSAHRAGLERVLRNAESHLGWLVLECTTDGEQGLVVGSQLACGREFRIATGDHTVELRAPDRRSAQVMATVVTGQRARVSATLDEHLCDSSGMLHMAGSEGGCCWPGQRFSGGTCAGAPECPADMQLEGGGCVPLEPLTERLATVHLSLLGGVTNFLQTDTALFRPGVNADGDSTGLGPRAELRVGIHLGSFLTLSGIVGGARQGVTHWIDCDAGTADCVDTSPLAYTIDFGAMLQAHTNPRRDAGNFDFHLGVGVRPWSRILLDDEVGTAKLTSTVVPGEVGMSLFLGSAVSLDLLGQAELWIPWKYCGYTPDRSFVCVGTEELEPELAWSALAGLTFHID